MNNTCEEILTIQGYGLAYLSADRIIISHNSTFSGFAGQHLDESPFIENIIPEVFGLEKPLAKVASGEEKYLILENVSRQIDESRELFLNISFFHLSDQSRPLLCLIQDVTNSALQKQKIIQQKHEINLLKHLSETRKKFLSSSLLGNSPPIKEIRRLIGKIALIPNSTVLLLGESGTGKNLAAQVIHYGSRSSDANFVEINCAAIPENLLESELFGYEKGAFTHAIKSKPGLLEEANGGTLFLDEIAEMPLTLQSKLLSVLESRRFRRLGSNREQEVHFRLIAATNRNLPQRISEGKFREDLYYRLNVISIELPPLRKMGQDILLIAGHFIEVFNLEFKKEVQGFTAAARQKLLKHTWPGNVRELSNCIERAMIFSEKNMIEEGELVFSKESVNLSSRWQIPATGIDLEEVEKQLILSALENSNGNKSQAARLLGLSRDTLRYRLEKYQID